MRESVIAASGDGARIDETCGSGRIRRMMFKHLRIALLLYVLLFVAVGQFLSDRRSRDWDDTLWVGVWLIDGSGTETTRQYVRSLGADAYAPVEQFFIQQAAAYGLDLDQPFRIRIAGQLEDRLPAIPAQGGILANVLFSLKLRWFVTRLHFTSDEPTPDITLFAIYHDADAIADFDRSTALRKGLIAIANLYASPRSRGSNQMIVAHELLHTLGATDKYDFASNQPAYPGGYAEPNRLPLYPQRTAELMAGRIPLSESEAAIPESLTTVTVGPATAFEIGWTRKLPAPANDALAQAAD